MGWTTELKTKVDDAVIEIFNLVYGEVMLGGNLETEIKLSFGKPVPVGNGLEVECFMEYQVFSMNSFDKRELLVRIPCSNEKTRINSRDDVAGLELNLTMILDMRVGELKLAFDESLDLLHDKERVLIEEHHVIRDAQPVNFI